MIVGIFNLTGTEQQQQIVKEAIEAIKFPFEKLTPPSVPVEIGWDDLNSGNYLKENKEAHAITGHLDKPIVLPVKQEAARFHGGTDHIRNYILGVMYPSDGRMYIDNYLVNNPDMAKGTVSAEIAHDVNYFLPGFDENKQRDIHKLMHGGEIPADEKIEWWELKDYGEEYFRLPGESFMQLFTLAYSDIPFGDASSFTHKITPEMAVDLRRILGIERTDRKPVFPSYYVPKGSKIYHKKIHGTMKKVEPTTNIFGLSPCKICKP